MALSRLDHEIRTLSSEKEDALSHWVPPVCRVQYPWFFDGRERGENGTHAKLKIANISIYAKETLVQHE